MTALVKIHPITNSRIIKSCIAIALISLCIYGSIFHTYSRSTNYLNTIAILIAGNSVSSITRTWITDESLNVLKRFLLTLFLLLIFSLAGVGVRKLQQVYYTYELGKYGQIGSGAVVLIRTPDFEILDDEYALVNYDFKGEKYLQKVDNKAGKYKRGDQLQIILSSRKPEILEVYSAEGIQQP